MNQGELCLVTGSTGAVGPALVETLLAEGYRVRAFARRAPLQSPPTGLGVMVGDVADREKIRGAVAEASKVFHLAAKLHLPNPSQQMRAEYERVNVEGTRILVEEAKSAGVKRLVFFSTVSVYGPTGRRAVDETAPLHPDTIYAETKLKAEEIVLCAKNAMGEPMGVVLRMSAVYGPGMKGNYASLVRALGRGVFVRVGNGRNYRTLIFERDAARAALLAAEHPSAAGRTFNVSDGTVHSLSEIVSAISNALGKKPPRVSVPVVAARLAAFWADVALRAAGRQFRVSPAVEKLVESVAVNADRIQRDLGFRPEFDLDRGWRETLLVP